MTQKEYLAMTFEELEELLEMEWDSMSTKERLMFTMIRKLINWNETQDIVIVENAKS